MIRKHVLPRIDTVILPWIPDIEIVAEKKGYIKKRTYSNKDRARIRI